MCRCMEHVHIRLYAPSDAAALAAIFFAAVRVAGARDYSRAQVEAWAPAIAATENVLARAGDGRLTAIAVDKDDTPLAYIDLEADGHIDHFYCHPDHIGTGIAAALYAWLEDRARERGVALLYVEASEAARRFFLRHGFTVTARRDFEVRGVPIHNYRMEKQL
jgi:putative acetyltransferase